MVKIHFLNVGHGDCTIIEHATGRLTMIDINNGEDLDSESVNELSAAYGLSEQTRSIRKILGGASDSALLAEKGYDIELTNPIAFLAEHYAGQPLFRYIQTHPDLDHMRGLAAFAGQGLCIVNFWDVKHEKIPDFQNDEDENDWNAYQTFTSQNGSPKVLQLYSGARGIYYNEEPDGVTGGDGIEILSPTPDLIQTANEADNTNDLSYVLRITYMGIRIILGGDAEEQAWESMVARYGKNLKCDVLKGSHHGRDSGYHQEAVRLMSPQYTILSVGKKPETDATNKYRQYSDHVWSTRWRGNITLTMDNNGKGKLDSEYDR
jgi:hypothetical protein